MPIRSTKQVLGVFLVAIPSDREFDRDELRLLNILAGMTGTALDRIGRGGHAGSRAVAEFLEQHQPSYFFCDHIHECAGVEIQLGRTRAVNVGKKGYLLELA